MKKVFSVFMLFILTFSLAGCGSKKASTDDVSVEVSDFKVVDMQSYDGTIKGATGTLNVTNNTDMYLSKYPVIMYFTDENDEYVENSFLTDQVTMYPQQSIDLPINISEKFFDAKDTGNVDFEQVNGMVVKPLTWDDFSQIYEKVKEKKPDLFDEDPTEKEFDSMIESCKTDEPRAYEIGDGYYAYTDSVEVTDVEIKDPSTYDDYCSFTLVATVKNVTDNPIDIGVFSVVVEGSKDGEVVTRFSESLHQEDFDSNDFAAGATDTYEGLKMENGPGVLGIDGETYYHPEDLTFTIVYAPILPLTIGR